MLPMTSKDTKERSTEDSFSKDGLKKPTLQMSCKNFDLLKIILNKDASNWLSAGISLYAFAF